MNKNLHPINPFKYEKTTEKLLVKKEK